MSNLKRLFLFLLFSSMLISAPTVSHCAPLNQLDSVVKVEYRGEYGGGSTATAWVLERHGTKYLITNHHFCDDYIDSGFRGYFKYKNDKFSGSSTYVASDEGKDLCLLTLEQQGAKALFLAPNKPWVMQRVAYIGYPKGIGPIYLQTFITAWVKNPWSLDIERAIFMSTECKPGSSGSPVLNRGGSVVGIVYAGARDTYGCLAVPTKEIRTFLRENNV